MWYAFYVIFIWHDLIMHCYHNAIWQLSRLGVSIDNLPVFVRRMGLRLTDRTRGRNVTLQCVQKVTFTIFLSREHCPLLREAMPNDTHAQAHPLNTILYHVLNWTTAYSQDQPYFNAPESAALFCCRGWLPLDAATDPANEKCVQGTLFHGFVT